MSHVARSTRMLAVPSLMLASACSIWQPDPELVTAGTRPSDGVLISNVRIIDVETGAALEHHDVLVKGETITGIRPHDPTRSAGQVVDGAGATLVPGLIDAHCHVVTAPTPPTTPALPTPELNLQRFLYAGVTTILDPLADASTIFTLREEVASETILGPTIYATGPAFTARGGHPTALIDEVAPPGIRSLLAWQLARQVDSEAEAQTAVQELAQYKPDLIKMAVDELPLEAPRLTEALVAAITRAATAADLRTIAHIGSLEDARTVGRAGGSAWIHGVYKERIPDHAIPELAAFGIPMTPTLTVFQAFGERGRGTFSATRLEQEVAPAALFDAWKDPASRASLPPKMRHFVDATYAQSANARDNVARLHAAGVTIFAGSDSQTGMLAGASLHIELGHLQQAGLTPIEVLQSATILPARFLANTDDPSFGRIAAGQRADLLLVEGDPLQDVAALADIRAVVLRGRVLERSAWPRE